jgi:uncharacterized protein YjlB
MHKVEPVKRVLEKVTGIGIPDTQQALSRVKSVEPRKMRFRPDPSLPLLLYPRAIRFERGGDPAAMLEGIFNANGWGRAWRDGIYDFVHYHPRIHEVLGVARAGASLRLGGNSNGTTIRVRAGDVVLIPAGVGHECLSASTDFLVVGAYPAQGTYSECRGSFQEYEKSRAAIRRVSTPKRDPVFGHARELI